ncbi:HDOD domain-containing protein [Myxococcota bacterium]|nr:HDOD domain-containing protein [Myxococcota bacterium]
MIDLTKLVERSHEVQPLPSTALRLSALVSNADGDLQDLVRVVELDAALAGRVLRLANSAALASRRTIGTVRDAVLRVGSGAVLSLAVAAGAKKALSADIPQLGLTGDYQWRHSVATALSAEVLRSASRVAVSPEVFTAALLHDLGKLVMGSLLEPDDLAFLARAQHEGRLTPIQAEIELLGVNHAELGGLVAQNWHLPDAIVRGITYHHAPDDVDDRLTDMVAVANRISCTCGITPPLEVPHPEDLTKALDRIHVRADDLPMLGERVVKRFSEVQGLYG